MCSHTGMMGAGGMLSFEAVQASRHTHTHGEGPLLRDSSLNAM
jgi:hypothetical protein